MINEIMKNEILFCIGENTVHKTNTVFSNTCMYLFNFDLSQDGFF